LLLEIKILISFSFLYRPHAGALIVMHKYFRARHPGRDWRDPRLHGCRR